MRINVYSAKTQKDFLIQKKNNLVCSEEKSKV